MSANAAAVSRVLARAKFRRSQKTRSGMIRGWSEWTEGYRCTKFWADTDTVLVEWKFHSFAHPNDGQRDVRAMQLARMSAAIEAAGYEVRTREGVSGPVDLVVSKPAVTK